MPSDDTPDPGGLPRNARRARQKQLHRQRVLEAQRAQARARRRRTIISVVGSAAVILVIAGLIAVFSGDDGDDDEASADDATTETTAAEGEAGADVAPPGPGATLTGETPCPPADGSAERTTGFAGPPPTCIDTARSYTATFELSRSGEPFGEVVVDLEDDFMTSTVNNFVVLARYGYYDGTELFRTDPSIDIIQGGSPTTNDASDPGPGYTIPDEGGTFAEDGSSGPFTYQPGQLIMARSAGPNSSGAQFFFSTGPNVANLDSQGTYLLFGTVTEGLELLQEVIGLHQPDDSGLGGAPSEPIVVEKVTITES